MLPPEQTNHSLEVLTCILSLFQAPLVPRFGAGDAFRGGSNCRSSHPCGSFLEIVQKRRDRGGWYADLPRLALVDTGVVDSGLRKALGRQLTLDDDFVRAGEAQVMLQAEASMFLS